MNSLVDDPKAKRSIAKMFKTCVLDPLEEDVQRQGSEMSLQSHTYLVGYSTMQGNGVS